MNLFIIMAVLLLPATANAQDNNPDRPPLRERYEEVVDAEKSFRYAFTSLTDEERLGRINRMLWQLDGFRKALGFKGPVPEQIRYPVARTGFFVDRETPVRSREVTRQYEEVFWYSTFVQISGIKEVYSFLVKKLEVLYQTKTQMEAEYLAGGDVYGRIIDRELEIQQLLPKVEAYESVIRQVQEQLYIIPEPVPANPEPDADPVIEYVYTYELPGLQDEPGEDRPDRSEVLAAIHRHWLARQFWDYALQARSGWRSDYEFTFPLGPLMDGLGNLTVNRNSAGLLEHHQQNYILGMEARVEGLLARLAASRELWLAARRLVQAREPLFERRDSLMISTGEYHKTLKEYYEARIAEARHRTAWHESMAVLRSLTGEGPVTTWKGN